VNGLANFSITVGLCVRMLRSSVLDIRSTVLLKKGMEFINVVSIFLLTEEES
jgi:hypothetical protein